jgi:DNA-binding MarR family transcriptional regulator
MDLFDATDGWPSPRETSVDAHVIASVHGAFHAMTRRVDMATRPHGLEAAEALVLAALLRDHGCAPFALRERLGFHRSTLSSLLDRLEHAGHIHRVASPFDGRRLEIRLTNAGTIAAETADLLIAEIEAELATYTSRLERRGAEAVFQAFVAIGRSDR